MFRVWAGVWDYLGAFWDAPLNPKPQNLETENTVFVDSQKKNCPLSVPEAKAEAYILNPIP